MCMGGGQMSTTRIPIISDGFLLGTDEEPTWFQEAVKLRDIIKFDGGVFIHTDIGKLYIEPGCYILKGTRGEYYTCSRETLESIVNKTEVV